MKRTYTLIALAFTATTTGTAALAAGPVDISPEPPVYSPPPAPEPTVGNWTGFYTGLQLGYADVDSDSGLLDGDDYTYGFHAGYDYDFGQYVLGGELDYDQADIDLGDDAGTLDSVARAKLRAGYDLGQTLVYATAGYARADTSVGDEDGYFYGLGVAYQITDRYQVGAEILDHKFDDVGDVSGNDLDATTFTIRGSLRF